MQINLLNSLAQLLQDRLRIFFNEEEDIPTFSLNGEAKHLNQIIHPNSSTKLTTTEQVVLLLAVASHLQPDFFDKIIAAQIPQAGDFPQLGGTRGKQFRGFLPTGQTARFLLAGDNLEKQIEVQQIFSEEHFFAKKQILWLEGVPEGEPSMSGKIILSKDYIDLLTTGKVGQPRFGMNFPAQLLETAMDWDDLVLNGNTLHQIKELENWLKYSAQLMDDWGMRKKLKPGYRVLFHGPPGTGKTLTASLLGKHTNKAVYRIDLSMVVSKFIGETEKNLSKLFTKAENKDWILFFDEADALFGKRTNVKDAHDKYANQEVSYLLQRVENYNGLVVLASNFKSNIDEAFLRRFQAIIHFPFPKVNERKRLWESAFPRKVSLSKEINLQQIAQRYELSGANIMNITQYACLKALEQRQTTIEKTFLLQGIEREYAKEGKMIP